jgi:hypothetical protein
VLVLVLAVQAVRIDKRENLYKELPPEGKGFDPERPDVASFGTWNLYRTIWR